MTPSTTIDPQQLFAMNSSSIQELTTSWMKILLTSFPLTSTSHGSLPTLFMCIKSPSKCSGYNLFVVQERLPSLSPPEQPSISHGTRLQQQFMQNWLQTVGRDHSDSSLDDIIDSIDLCAGYFLKLTFSNPLPCNEQR